MREIYFKSLKCVRRILRWLIFNLIDLLSLFQIVESNTGVLNLNTFLDLFFTLFLF